MPLTFLKQIDEATKIGVWQITESEEFFLDRVSVQREITHPHKRRQHLAGRFLLRELVPDFPIRLITIADTRKPFLADEAYHFSLSHCGDYAAAIVSTICRVGVDIEIPQPKIERVRHKFLSPEEQQMIEAAAENYHFLLTLAWSVKEAVFKWFGAGDVDFINHMHLSSIKETPEGFETRCLFRKNGTINLRVYSIKVGGNILSRVTSG